MKKFTLIEKAFLLKKAAPFQELDLNLLLAIADKLGTTHYRAGDPIFVRNEEATRMYFVAQGEVEILDENKQRVDILYPTNYFGDEALFNDRNREYYATSRIPSLLFTLSRAHLHNIISECPSVALGFLRDYATLFPHRPHSTEQELS